MTAAILDKPTAWEIAMDLEVIHTSLRVTNEMMLEQLCTVFPKDFNSVTKTHERLFLLIELIPKKLEELDKLHDALLTIHRESKKQQPDNIEF